MNLFHSVSSRQGTILYGVARLRCVVREGGLARVGAGVWPGLGQGISRVGVDLNRDWQGYLNNKQSQYKQYPASKFTHRGYWFGPAGIFVG